MENLINIFKRKHVKNKVIKFEKTTQTENRTKMSFKFNTKQTITQLQKTEDVNDLYSIIDHYLD